jgi:hypothetical protein
MTTEPETYGVRNFLFDDFLPAALEFHRVGENPNTNLTPTQQNQSWNYSPDPVRTDDPNSDLLYGMRLNGFQWFGLAVAAGLTIYLVKG